MLVGNCYEELTIQPAEGGGEFLLLKERTASMRLRSPTKK